MLALVVDDDPVIRSFVQSILHADNFATLEAEDRVHALDVVRMLDGAVDLIVTDIQMPGGDGIGLANSVHAAFPGVAIILMSGYPQPDCDFPFIEKPFSWQVMRSMVRHVLKKAARVA